MNLLRLRPTDSSSGASGTDWVRESRQGIQELIADENVHIPDVTAPTEKVLASSRFRLASFWTKEGEGFTSYWTNITQAERVGILRTVAPFMPCRRGDRYVVIDGVNIDLNGIALLCVELNVAGLTNRKGESGLVQLVKQRVQQGMEILRGREDALITTHDEDDVKYMTRVINTGQWSTEDPSTYIYVRGERKGQLVTLTAAQAAKASSVLGPDAMQLDLYRGVLQRQTALLQTLLLVTDIYLEDSDKRKSAVNLAKSVGCPVCGTVSDSPAADRAKIFACPCRLVAYCSMRCQRQHWPQHKATCSKKKGGNPGTGLDPTMFGPAERTPLSSPDCPCCWNCGAEDAISGNQMSKCARCKTALYCGSDCQRQHWAEHKLECTAPPAAEQVPEVPDVD